MASWQPAKICRALDPERGEAALDVVDAAALTDEMRAFLQALAANSPYLSGLITRDPDYARQVFSGDPDDLAEEIITSLEAEGPEAPSLDSLMSLLRRAKAQVALLTGAMDVAGIWDLQRVTTYLSRFAETALDLAVARLLHDAMTRGDLAWPQGAAQPPTPALAQGSGLTVLALGKLGGLELNYSSDLDLMLFYDQALVDYRGRRTASDCFVKLTRELGRVMQSRTEDGYVFRIDLRLRPDPGATPVAMAMEAAETYYQSLGQTWERSAMIKARVVAGDREAGARFLSHISPFVWRRNLDFAAIQDIHDIKNRVHEFHRHGAIAVAGHDVKLGRGGIREIEFLAQIHQLIAGGREESLRSRATLETLATLCQLGRIEPAAEETLREAYIFLRTLEHRLQMIDDEQTHAIPTDDAGLEHIAAFMGFPDRDAFEEAVMVYLECVRRHYDELLGESEEGGEDGAALAGQELPEYLAGLKFSEPEPGAEVIEHWRTGRYRALRTERARRLLEACLKELLAAFAATSDPDQALRRFDNFLSRLPAGVQIFSLLQANPWLFRLIAKVMGNAPALADHLSRQPALLDSVLDPGFYDPLPDPEALDEQLAAALGRGGDYQDMLDASRRWLNDARFQVGVHILEGLIGVEESGAALTMLADVVLRRLLPQVEADFAAKHGSFAGGDLALIAMGSYGGGNLSHASDLDMILLYDADFNTPASDGAKPLGPSQYFSRLGQHVITAITALTGEGRLYELDLRLRPSGAAGPLVVTLKTFAEYQQESAWTWEHMALIRARVVRGGKDFSRRIEKSIDAILTARRDPAELAASVRKMRGKLDAEFGPGNMWETRYMRGGLIDLEFTIQFLLLREGHRHPDIFAPSLAASLDNLAEIGALESARTAELKAAHELMLGVRGLLRLCLGATPQEEEFSLGLQNLLAQATGSEDFKALKSRLARAQSLVYAFYEKHLGGEETATAGEPT
jgi:glutamate-ammonia-ligase adenylyltransferase